MSLAGVYFTAMYVFHSSLNGSSPRQPQPPKKWDAGDDDVELPQRLQRQRRLSDDRLDGDRQAAFDDIRRLEQQREIGHETRDKVVLEAGQPSSTSDVNIPASCNASASDRRRRDGEFIPLAGLYLLSAFWDERPNDFDNRHNGTLVRLMAIVHEGPRYHQLACDFGGSRQTTISFYEMCENHHKPFGSFIMSCRVPYDVLEAPCSVTVVAKLPDGDSSVDVPVRTLRPQSLSRSFTVCVPPLFGDVPPARLTEFFEVTAKRSVSVRKIKKKLTKRAAIVAFQWLDAVGCATGRLSGLQKFGSPSDLRLFPNVYFWGTKPNL